MKIRQGFVTNSSSSSFVIAIKNDGSQTLDAFIKAFIDTSYCETCHGHSFTSKEELDKYYVDRYSYKNGISLEEILSESAYLKEAYEKELKYIEKGFVVVSKDIDHDHEGLRTFISLFTDLLGENAFVIDTD